MHAGGRPTLYRPEMCERVIEVGRQGYGREEIAADLDVAWATMLTWEKEHPEFLTATTRARELSAAWWAAKGRTGVDSREFNSSAYSLQVRNRFRDLWAEKTETAHTGKVEVETASPIERARALAFMLRLAAEEDKKK